MPPPNPNPITESSILTTYLLTPSTLPTILPYSTFKTLAKKANSTLNDSSDLRRLYRDFQFQRDITLDQVRDAIERESTVRAAILKTQLARRLAIEEGEADENQRPRKRRRVDDEEQGRSSDDELSSSDDEFSNPTLIAAQKAIYYHPDSSHPAAHVMPAEGEVLQRKLLMASRSAYHTRESLLREMEQASRSVDEEIAELEAECGILSSGIKETVGSLSDLRYGRRQSGDEEGAEAYKEVLEAIEQFRSVVSACTKT